MRSWIAKVETVVGGKYEKHLLTCKNRLDKWFGTERDLPRVFFVQSRKDYDKLFGCKTESWQVARTENGVIYILDPKIYTKQSDHKDFETFWKVLKHEYVHLYFRKLTNSGNPRWINEGLACYLAEQVKKTPEQKVLLRINEFYDKGGSEIYSLGYFWVKTLIEKFGDAKLLKLIRGINAKMTKTQFAKHFKKIYGFGLTKAELKKLVELATK